MIVFPVHYQSLDLELIEDRANSGCGLVSRPDGSQYAMVFGGVGATPMSEVLDLVTLELNEGNKCIVNLFLLHFHSSYFTKLPSPITLFVLIFFRPECPPRNWSRVHRGVLRSIRK